MPHFFRNRPLCCLRVFQDDAQDCFFIGVIGFNFCVIGVMRFGVNDTILINSRLFPIKVDAEIAAHIDQLRLTKAIFLCFPEHFRNTAAPCLHDVHVGKGGCNTTVADLREAGLHLLNRDFAVQHTGEVTSSRSSKRATWILPGVR